ncbi:synaptotagmin-like protein 5 [Trichonephila inaurata madagascariensis]|uniref:Synaptotagmin-like protein 5 n=1 Tax=Trichonephila inaurata madagascariensis TaxID=2747483 RepID=A0A8X6M8K2_9ARAC|nr:synaptotagmin-like protein 5 [Trichonephila inaurata madagascariensis]
MTGCALLSVIVSFLPCNCFCKRKSKVPIKNENNSTILNNEKESTNAFEVNDTSKSTNQHLENNEIQIPPPPENVCQNDCEDVTKEESDIALTVTNESGNSLRSSPHGRLRMRNRSLSGGSEDGKQRKTSVPQISVSECLENPVGRLSAASSEKDSSGVQEDEIDQAFAYHCRSQMSLSSFGGRSESVTSVYSAAGGGRYGTVTVTGEVLFGLSYNYKTSTLEINIKECRNLAAVDMKRNRSDPYVKVYLLPDRTKSGKRKTKVKKHTLNPVFEESLKFHVTINELVIRTLWLSVWHSDRFGRNDFLGEVMLPLGSDVIESSGSKWYPLQERVIINIVFQHYKFFHQNIKYFVIL